MTETHKTEQEVLFQMDAGCTSVSLEYTCGKWTGAYNDPDAPLFEPSLWRRLQGVSCHICFDPFVWRLQAWRDHTPKDIYYGRPGFYVKFGPFVVFGSGMYQGHQRKEGPTVHAPGFMFTAYRINRRLGQWLAHVWLRRQPVKEQVIYSLPDGQFLVTKNDLPGDPGTVLVCDLKESGTRERSS